MAFFICLLIIIYILWELLIKGALWKIILGAFGWFGMYMFLSIYWKLNTESPFKNNFMSWASIIPTILVLLVMVTTKEE